MKINWKVRIKNTYFWVGLLGVILSAMGVSADMFTSWDIVIAQAKALISNPFMIGSVIMAVLGSTLIACEQTGRKCRMMELDEKYCDVIRRRRQIFATR